MCVDESHETSLNGIRTEVYVTEEQSSSAHGHMHNHVMGISFKPYMCHEIFRDFDKLRIFKKKNSLNKWELTAKYWPDSSTN